MNGRREWRCLSIPGCTVIPSSMHQPATTTPTDCAIRIKGYNLDEFPVHHRAYAEQQTLTLTITDSLELPISLMRKSPDCKRKLELQARTQPLTDTETICKYEKWLRQNWSLNRRRSFGRNIACNKHLLNLNSMETCQNVATGWFPPIDPR